jgi:hypothetical protein
MFLPFDPVLYWVADFDKAYADRKAEEYQKNKEKYNIPSKKYDKESSESDVHARGIIGDLIVSHYFDVPYNDEVYIGGDGGRDTYLGPNIGWSQNKCRSREDYDFSLNDSNPHLKAEVGILIVRVKYPYLYKIIGWISRKDFLDKHETRDYKYGDRAMVPQVKMRDIRELKRIKDRV